MNRYLFIIFSCLALLSCTVESEAQYFPDTAWTRCYGGSGGDEGLYIQQTFDGGYIVLGTSNSMDGDLVNPPAGDKSWILKLDSIGNIEWQKYMSNVFIVPQNIQQTADSGYIVGGDKFTKLDQTGNIDVQLNIQSRFVLETYDGGYALTSWVSTIKLSPAMTVDWSFSIGMAMHVECFTQTPDSGFILGNFIDEDQGPDTHELSRIDKDGLDLYWALVSSGGSYDDRAVKCTLDNSFVWVGQGDSYMGSWGYITKRDSSLKWSKAMGDIYPSDIVQNIDSTYIFCGRDTFNNAIISKIAKTGNDIVTMDLGGTSNEKFHAIQITKDTGYVVVGTTNSTDADVWGNHGGKDIWIVKWKQDTSIHAAPPVLSVKQTSRIDEVQVYPTLSNGIVHVSLPEGYEGAEIAVFDIVGRQIEVKNSGAGGKRSIDISKQPAGQYVLRVRMDGERRSFRVSLNP